MRFLLTCDAADFQSQSSSSAAGGSWWDAFRELALNLLKISPLGQETFRKTSLVPGMVGWHSRKVLNVFACLTDRKPGGEAPALSLLPDWP